MKVPSILSNVMPSSYSRGRTREGSGAFLPLSTTLTEVHLRPPSSRANDLSGRQRLLSCSGQKPIELTSLTGTPRQINEAGQSSSNQDTRPSTNSNAHSGQFHDGSEFETDFQVYNPTSENLPNANEPDDSFPLGLEDVRLRFSEYITGEGADEDIVPKMYTGEKSFRCCYISIKEKTVCKAGAFLICTAIILLALIAAYFILKNNATIDDNEDVKVLFTHNWPMEDIEDKSENISFNTVENLDTNDLADYIEKKKQKNAASVLHSQVTKRRYPGMFSVDGHFVDQHIVEDVLHSARGILKIGLNENRLNATDKPDSLDGLFEESLCQHEPKVKCNETAWFRSINGSCNNVFHTSWGSQFASLRRILKPDTTTAKLPVGKFLTTQLTEGTLIRDANASAMLPLWAMFILHDTLKAPAPLVDCHDSTDYISNEVHAKMEIVGNSENQICDKDPSIATSDAKAFCNYTIPCSAVHPSCAVGPRTSFNLATSYIDASNIYGSSEERTNKLRLMHKGKLKTIQAIHKEQLQFLPLASDLNETCLLGHGAGCFLSGDDDVNQLTALTALNTIFVRHHNRIAEILSRINVHWNDERLFQESRKLVIAQIQHITYNEYLPELLGPLLMNMTKLQLQTEGYYELYNSKMDAAISDAFAGAVGHFWYSMAVGKVQSIWKVGKHSGKKELDISSQILKPGLLIKGRGHLEDIIRGFSRQHVNRVGLEFSPKLRSLHIKTLNKTLDLVKWVLELGQSLDLPPYVEWRKLCGFPEIRTFLDLKNHWYTEAYSRVTSVYSNVHEVDLFTGMLAELPLPSVRVGPLLACFLIDQFTRFKQGDRFWYEGDVYFHHFTEPQLQTIRTTTLSRIICDNTDRNFEEIQKSSMLVDSPTNPLLHCADLANLPDIDFHLWKENPTVHSPGYSVQQSSVESESEEEWNFEYSAEETNSSEQTTGKDKTVPVVNQPHTILFKLTTPKSASTNVTANLENKMQ